MTASWDGAPIKMAFVSGGGGPRAVLAWPSPQPLLSDVCAVFEQFGLRVAGEQRVCSDAPGPSAMSLFDFAAPQQWGTDSEARVTAAIEASGARGFVIDDSPG
jgi:glutamate dehydrogenase